MASKLTFNLTQEQEVRIKNLHNPGRETVNELITRVVNQGLYALEYRKVAYPKKKEQMKEMRHLYKIAREDPELAVKLGLGTRS